MVKQAGGVFIPASDIEAEKMTRFKTGLTFPVDIKQSRNQKFHGKVFSFFTYCFDYWQEKNRLEFADESKQFDYFRKELTKIAGFYNQVFDLRGNFTIEAKSLAFGSMGQDEFESCYKALIDAAMVEIFKDMNDQDYYNKLAGFF